MNDWVLETQEHIYLLSEWKERLQKVGGGEIKMFPFKGWDIQRYTISFPYIIKSFTEFYYLTPAFVTLINQWSKFMKS